MAHNFLHERLLEYQKNCKQFSDTINTEHYMKNIIKTIHIAIVNNEEQQIDKAIEKGFDINLLDWEKNNLISHTIDYDILELLIQKGIDLYNINEYGSFSLNKQTNYTQNIQLLLDYDYDIFIKDLHDCTLEQRIGLTINSLNQNHGNKNYFLKNLYNKNKSYEILRQKRIEIEKNKIDNNLKPKIKTKENRRRL